MLVILFAFAAGVVTILAPCILPVLPIVLSGGVTQGRLRPWGIIIGVIFSFSIFTLALSWAVQHLGLSPNFSRIFGITIIGFIGVLFLVPGWMSVVEGWISARLTHFGKPTVVRQGFGGGVLLGLGLGAVWTPCAGPILASVVAAAQTGAVTNQTVAITVAYAIGAAIPMGLIAGLGQRTIGRVRWLGQRAQSIQKIFGIVIIVAALLMVTNIDRRIQTWIISVTPNWLPKLQQFEDRVNMKTGTNPSAGKTTTGLKDYGLAPELDGITGWINTKPTTLSELRGKVVLVKFWTYTCINCIRTLPYVQAWYDKYHDQGFEIIAVHTPEFVFEKIPANVEKAVKDFSITYPVALDPDYGTWNAYQNRYWPAKYFIDAKGHLRYVHFGEGGYDESERIIQELLRESGQTISDSVTADARSPFIAGQSPETYFGVARSERFASDQDLSSGKKTYTVSRDLMTNAWAFQGDWLVGEESSTSQPGSVLTMRVATSEMYVVMTGLSNTPSPINVYVNGVGTTQLAVSSSTGDQTLYRVAQFPTFGEQTVTLEFPEGNVAVYAATFSGQEPSGLACGLDGRCSIVPTKQ